MGVFLFLLASILAITATGILMVKHLDQTHRDRNRRTYKLSFPNELDVESVTAWIRSISGTLRYGSSRLVGVPTIGFELLASSQGLTHRMMVPWQHADYVISQLRSLVPGIRVTPEDDFERHKWTHAVEVRLTHSSRQLRIYSASDTAASLLASVQALNDKEHVLIQWVITPTPPIHMPVHQEAKSHHLSPKLLLNGNMANRDEVNDRREKLKEPNVLAVLRIASVAETSVRAEHLVYRVRASLASARSPSTRFIKRLVSKSELQRRIDRGSGAVNFPIQLSAPEIAALIAWPIGNPFVSGLPPMLARHLPPSDLVPKEGRIIGLSNMPGNERPLAVGYTEALKHMHVMGPTGVGKTVLLANMMRQDIAAGYGVILIENKGDLFHSALDYIPPDRIDDVVVLDVNDVMRPVGFNILNQGNPDVVIDELAMLFDSLYAESKAGVWTREVMYHGLRTLVAVPGLSFVDLAALLVPSADEVAWRDAVMRNLRDKELRKFWQRFENLPRAAQDRYTQPVMDRIWQLTSRPKLRNIIGQATSSFQMADVVRDNKILLVNLSGIEREAASLTGTLLMNALWHAVKTTRSDRPTYLYLDEFQDFLNLPTSDPEDMLAKARGYGLGMTLAHQHLGQLSPVMKSAVMANARTKVVFQTSADDARAMAREFGKAVDEYDFQHLGRYEAVTRVATADGVSQPMTLTTSEPAKGEGRSKQVKYVSRTTYGRPVQEVEEDIEARHASAKVPVRKRPKVGSDDGW